MPCQNIACPCWWGMECKCHSRRLQSWVFVERPPQETILNKGRNWIPLWAQTAECLRIHQVPWHLRLTKIFDFRALWSKTFQYLQQLWKRLRNLEAADHTANRESVFLIEWDSLKKGSDTVLVGMNRVWKRELETFDSHSCRFQRVSLARLLWKLEMH